MKSRTAGAVALMGAISASAISAQQTTGASFTFQGQEKTLAKASRIDGESVSRFFDLGAGCDGRCIALGVLATSANMPQELFTPDKVQIGQRLRILNV